jgi:hypothetical protein
MVHSLTPEHLSDRQQFLPQLAQSGLRHRLLGPRPLTLFETGHMRKVLELGSWVTKCSDFISTLRLGSQLCRARLMIGKVNVIRRLPW